MKMVKSTTVALTSSGDGDKLASSIISCCLIRILLIICGQIQWLYTDEFDSAVIYII